MKTKKVIIADKRIQTDASKVGHHWRDMTTLDLLPSIVRDEIEGEIMDGGVETTPRFIGSNGEHYRWQ